MKITKLQPTDSRNSFYGKASIIETKNRYYLLSYSTIVCSIVKKSGRFHRHWDNYSSTTMRHINSFLNYCSAPGGGKKWWDSLDCSAIPREIDREEAGKANKYRINERMAYYCGW